MSTRKKTKVGFKPSSARKRESLAEKMARVSRLIEELECIREKAGVSVEELLEGLAEERRRLYQERYGQKVCRK